MLANTEISGFSKIPSDFIFSNLLQCHRGNGLVAWDHFLLWLGYYVSESFGVDVHQNYGNSTNILILHSDVLQRTAFLVNLVIIGQKDFCGLEMDSKEKWQDIKSNLRDLVADCLET